VRIPFQWGDIMTDARGIEELTREESLRLLASVPVGRVVFSHRALPAIRPVNHLVAGDQIIIRANLGSTLSRDLDPGGGMVVAYEGDMLEAENRAGWSVVVVGRACRVTDEAAAERYRRVLQAWVSGTMADVISIQAEIVTGVRLVPWARAASPADGTQPAWLG
jgi:hypothetical protein